MMRTKVSDIQVKDHVIQYHKEQSTPSMARSQEHVEQDEKVDLNRFEFLWAVTDYIDWENSPESTKMLETTLYNSLSKEQAEQLHTEFATVKNTLDHVLFASGNSNVDEFFGGDDSYSDLLDHIVSLGKDFVADIAANKESAWQHLREKPPIEAFSYVLPHEFDYEYKPDTLQHQAQQKIDDIESKIEVLEQDDCLKDEYKNRVIESARILAKPLQQVIDGDDLSLENTDMEAVKNSVKSFNNMAQMAHSAIEISKRNNNDEEYMINRIIDYSIVNIPQDYLEEKKALKETESLNVDFSQYDQSYRDKFNQVDETPKDKPTKRPKA